jgi:glycine/D-amino acid oxidase-like deaminating enzyme
MMLTKKQTGGDTSNLPTLWQQTASPSPKTTPLGGDSSTDIAIIGGGLSGLSAALHLSEAAIPSLLLEAGRIGDGASGANTGWWVPGLALLDAATLDARLGPERADALRVELAASARSIPELVRRHRVMCDLSTRGVLYAASTPKTLAKISREAERWAAAGSAIDVVGQAAMPGHLATDHYIGGVLYADGGTLNPLAFCNGLAAAAIAQGALIHTCSPAIGIARERDGWRVDTARGSVRARAVLLATGASPQSPWPAARNARYRLKIAMVASAPFADHGRSILPSGVPFTDMDSFDTLGGAFDPAGRLVMSILPGTSTRPRPADLAAPYWRKFRQIFPQAPADPGWEFGWFGHEAVPPGRMASIHEPEPGLFVLQGYAGNGINQAIHFGRAIARSMASGDRDAIEIGLTPLRPARGATIASALANRLLLPLARTLVYR